MLTRTVRYYRGRLDKYFDKRFGEYEDTVEYHNDPAVNKWRFVIPELGIEVELTCDDSGQITEKQKELISNEIR